MRSKITEYWHFTWSEYWILFNLSQLTFWTDRSHYSSSPRIVTESSACSDRTSVSSSILPSIRVYDRDTERILRTMSRVQSERRHLEWQSRGDDSNTSCDIFSRNNCGHDHIFQIVTRIAIRTVGILDLTSRVFAGFAFYLQIMKISCKWDVNLTFTTWSFIIAIRELSWKTPDPWLQRRDIYTLIKSRTIRIHKRNVLNASIKRTPSSPRLIVLF